LNVYVGRKKGWGNWTTNRPGTGSFALVLLSASRAAVEFITKPESREEAGNQLQDAFAQIDFDAAAQAVTQAIDTLASSSKGRLNDTIDTLRDKSFDVVDEAKSRAEDKLAPSKREAKVAFPDRPDRGRYHRLLYPRRAASR
jgi:hypothetical protein